MQLDEHPFQVLGINSRTCKQEIFECAEALAARSQSDKLAAFRFQVTHPIKRLDAEVSWFPGVAPARIRQIIDTINRDLSLPVKFEEKLPGIDCLCKFNALTYWLGTHDGVSPPAWGLALHQLSHCIESVSPEDIAETVNADRSAAGFPAIADFDAVRSAVTRHADAAAAFLAERLTRCPQHAQVLALIVERRTDRGESQASEFLGRFVDRYQIQVQPILEKHRDAIAVRCERVLAIAQGGATDAIAMDAAIEDLEEKLSEWDTVAQPIQLLMKSRGLRDAHSIEVAQQVRSVAVTLANECDLHDQAQRITSILHDVFEEVPEVAEVAEQDSEALDEILAAKEARRKREEEYRREIALDMIIGKDRLQINHEFIAYKGRRLSLDEVARLRWGILKHYTNGIRTNREFTVWIAPADHGRGIVVECVRFLESERTVLQRYLTIIEKLWKAIGFRLLLDMAARLMRGEALTFGDVAVIKSGIWLPKRKWFSSERYFAPWEELSKATQGGELWIGSTKEPKASASLSLRDLDNAVILERLLDILWKDGNYAKLRSGTLFQDDSDEPETTSDEVVDEGAETYCRNCETDVTPTSLGLCSYCGRRL